MTCENTLPPKSKITALPSLSRDLCRLPYATSMKSLHFHSNMDPESEAKLQAICSRNVPSTPSSQSLYSMHMPPQTYPESQTCSESPPDGLMMRSKSKFSI